MKKNIVLGCMTALCIVGLMILTSGKSQDAKVGGFYIRSQKWSGTIVVTRDVNIAPWATLTIAPGTKVLFEKGNDVSGTPWTKYADEFIKTNDDPTGREGYGDSHYHIFGRLKAVGTKEQPIIFTSAQAKPEYADWDQIIALGGSIFEYVEVAYAHNGINVEGGGVVIRNSKIHDSLWSCVDIFSSGNVVEYNEIYHCWHQAVGIKKESDNIIRGNTIHDAQLGVNCEFGALPTIANNFFRSAPMNPECGRGIENEVREGIQNVVGGTYGGKVIYPARE